MKWFRKYKPILFYSFILTVLLLALLFGTNIFGLNYLIPFIDNSPVLALFVLIIFFVIPFFVLYPDKKN